MRNSKHQKGMSALELVIVALIVAVVLCIAIPLLLAAKRGANENATISNLRALATAQETYKATTGNGSYAKDLKALADQGLINKPLSDGRASGYTFVLFDQSGSGTVAMYTAYAFPDKKNGVDPSGTRRFGITEDGIVRGDNSLKQIPNSRFLVVNMPALEDK